MAVGLVQVRNQTTAATTSATATLLSAATAGNLLVVLVGTPALQTVTAVTTGFTKDQGGSSSLRLHVYSKVAVGGETTFQFNTSVSQGQTTFFYEFSGISAGVLDQFANGSGTSVTSMSTGTTPTTTAADEAAVAIVAAGSTISSGGPTWSNGFTDAGAGSTSTRGSYKLLTATGTQETTWGVWTTARTGNSTILTYKAGGTTTTVTPTPGAITLAGQGVSLSTTIGAAPGAITLTGSGGITVGILATLGVTELLDTGATTDATSYTQATSGFASLSATPAAGSYVIVGIEASRGDTTNVTFPATITVAGVSLARVDQTPYKPSGANQMGLAVYVGTGSWSGTSWDTGALGFSATGCRIAAYQVTGTTGAVQSAKNTWVTSGVSGVVTLASATPASSKSRTFAFGGANSSPDLETVDTDFTELAHGSHSSPSEALWAAWSASTFEQVATTGHGNGTNAGAIVVELGAAFAPVGGAVTITVDVPGAVTLAGQAPVLTDVITAGAGAIAIAGAAPELRTTITAGAGAITLAGQTVTTAGGGNVTISVDVPGAITLAGAAPSLITKISSAPGAITLAGQTVTIATTIAAAAGAITLAGQTVTIAKTISSGAGAVTLAGQTVTTSGTSSTTITVDLPGAITLAGGLASLRIDLRASFGAVSLAGGQISAIRSVVPTAGALTIAGQATALRELLTLAPGAITLVGRTVVFVTPPEYGDNAGNAAAADRIGQGTGPELSRDLVTVDLRSGASGGE